MNTTIKNEAKLWLFTICIGGFAGAVIWTFLKVMALGADFLWKWIPSVYSIPFYTIIVCTVGGFIMGVIRKKFGDYPEELDSVMTKVKTEKQYDYSKMPVMLACALLPLIIGSSVGPEAGLTGIIVGICYWVGDNLKFARQNSKEYSQIGVAVSLGVLFHSPLFGIFAVEETDDNEEVIALSNSTKILLYGLALGAGMGIYMILTSFFGSGMSGFPSFEAPEINRVDYAMMLLYIPAGCILAVFYNMTHHGCAVLANKTPAVVTETLAGFVLGIAATFVPAMMFSGEHQMGELMTEYVHYLPIALIGAAFLKVILTNICIQFGLKGGHFFPVIFAGVCLGYGLAMLIVPNGGHEVFGAAVVTAVLLGATMHKPLAVTFLLFICFPIKMFLWIFIAAALGAKLVPAMKHDK